MSQNDFEFGDDAEEEREILSPEEFKAMSPEERDEWTKKQEERLSGMAEDASQLSADQQAVLDELAAVDEEEHTTGVQVGNRHVTVKTYLNASVEDKMADLASLQEGVEGGELKEARRTIAETLAWLIEDDRYGDPDVWHVYASEYGLATAMERLFEAADPALSRMSELGEEARKFREE